MKVISMNLIYFLEVIGYQIIQQCNYWRIAIGLFKLMSAMHSEIISFSRTCIKIHTFQFVKKRKYMLLKMVKIIFTTIGERTI